jgi:hypothetical protein
MRVLAATVNGRALRNEGITLPPASASAARAAGAAAR